MNNKYYLTLLLSKEKNRLAAVFIGPALLISLFIIFMVPSQSMRLGKIQDQLGLYKGMGRLKAALEESNQAISSFEGSVYPQEQLNMVLKAIESEALKNDLYINVIAPRPFFEDGVNGYKLTEIELKLKGAYHDLGRFLNNLEVKQCCLQVKSMNIVAMPNEAGVNKMELVLGVLLKKGGK